MILGLKLYLAALILSVWIVAAAEEWKEKHKLKTLLEVLKERFPYAPMHYDGTPVHCPHVYFGKDVLEACESLKPDKYTCRDCWNSPAPEMYQGKE